MASVTPHQPPDTSKPLVYISVLNWNSADNTICCLESLQHLNYPNYRILVVDNAPMDDSIARIHAAFPDIEIICSPENLGYAGGNRLALERALRDGAELFWILNNDAQVEPGALTALVEAYERHRLAIFGSVIVKPGTQRLIAFGGGWSLDAKGCPHAVGIYNNLAGLPYNECFSDPKDRVVGTVEGSSMMIPIEIVKTCGFMDESFFLNVEEVEYCFRLARHGIPSIIVPNSIVIHGGGGSYNYSPMLRAILKYYRQRNRLVLIRKYEGLRLFLKELCRYFKNTKRFQLLAILRPQVARADDLEAYMIRLGVIDAILGRMGKRFAPEDYIKKG